MRSMTLLACILLTACATAPAGPEFETPTCSSERECDAKWRAAESWIIHRAGRPIMEKTDDMMRTHMDRSPGNHLSVRVEKKEIEPGVHAIEASIYCGKRVGCDPSPWQALQQFNRSVNRAWMAVGEGD